MPKEPITFNDLPMVVEHLLNKVEGMEGLLRQALQLPKQEKADKHVPLTVEQACEYLNMPKATFYYKVGRGEIPAIKQGKRYYIYQDELDAWLEAARTNGVPQSAEETNTTIQASHRRKPNPVNW